MKTKILLILCISIVFFSCKKDEEKNEEKTSYLDQWVGKYKGTSHHWSTYPSDTILITNDEYKEVSVEVKKNETGSSLDLTLTYNDGNVDFKNGLEFSSSGHHFSKWGGGSGYGSLTIDFMSNSLCYDYFQKCGIPCDSGIDFTIKKE